MDLLTAPTKTEQVAKYLKDEINSQKLSPGDKLPSIRALGNSFSTSEQVIKSAYNILEKEGLIYKLPRKGAFVNKASALSHLNEIYILGASLTDENRYFKMILDVTYPPLLQENCSFTAKTYPPEITVEQLQEIEVTKINQMNSVDCVLIHAVSSTKKEVLNFRQIEKPVVFIGDFSSAGVTDLKYNQITGDNAWLAEQYIEYMFSKGYKEVALFSGSLEHYFNKLFFNGVRSKAKKLGMKIKLVEFPRGASSSSRPEIQSILTETLQQYLKNGPACRAGIISGLERSIFQATLRKMDGKFYKKIFFSPEGRIDYTPLHEAINKRIAELIAEPDTVRKIRVKLPLVIK
jgi:DNA-binding LacI/PurR family transcriptional regulator